MLKNYHRHIIWDWNGTLLNDVQLCVSVINESLEKRQLPPVTLVRYAEVFRFPVIDYYRAVGFDFAIEPFEVVSTEFIEVYLSRVDTCGLHTDASVILEQVAQSGRTQSILSAAKQDHLRAQVDRLGIASYFTDVIGIENHHAAGKVERAREWLAATDVDPAQAVFIGDTVHDHEVARELGVDCILISAGHQNRARLEQTGRMVLDSLAALLK